MTNEINTGGPAFPFGQVDFETGQLCNGWGSEGLSVRDYFAAKAMQAIVSTPKQMQVTAGDVSTLAYQMADAMIKARNA